MRELYPGTKISIGPPIENGFYYDFEFPDGVKVAEEDLERIFNLHFTTKPDGHGVGLSMVYRTVQLHDGRIDVTSSVGRGTTFTIRFPIGAPGI